MQAFARAVTLHLEDWLTERQEHLRLIAVQASGRLDTPRLGTLLTGITDTYDDYRPHPDHRSARQGAGVQPAGQELRRPRPGLACDRHLRKSRTDLTGSTR